MAALGNILCDQWCNKERIYVFMYRIEFMSYYTTYLLCKSALTKGALLFHLDSSVEFIIIIADWNRLTIVNLNATSVCLKYDRHPSSVVHRMHAKCFWSESHRSLSWPISQSPIAT